jgi:hypothetical protein
MKIVIENIKHKHGEYSQMSGTCSMVTVDYDYKFPKSLLTAAQKWFEEFCEEYAIDSSKYPFIRIWADDPTWQINFCRDEDGMGRSISLFNIYFDGRTRKILQAEWGI